MYQWARVDDSVMVVWVTEYQEMARVIHAEFDAPPARLLTLRILGPVWLSIPTP